MGVVRGWGGGSDIIAPAVQRPGQDTSLCMTLRVRYSGNCMTTNPDYCSVKKNLMR